VAGEKEGGGGGNERKLVRGREGGREGGGRLQTTVRSVGEETLLKTVFDHRHCIQHGPPYRVGRGGGACVYHIELACIVSIRVSTSYPKMLSNNDSLVENC
jgi:hypothetical protein